MSCVLGARGSDRNLRMFYPVTERVDCSPKLGWAPAASLRRPRGAPLLIRLEDPTERALKGFITIRLGPSRERFVGGCLERVDLADHFFAVSDQSPGYSSSRHEG
jgi:hypothetical protein